MYLLRSATLHDLEALFELSTLMNFINLPNDKAELTTLLETSEKSFTNPDSNKDHNIYVFVVQDIKTKKIVGTSGIQAQHGSPEEPHYYLKVGTENKYCQSLNTGFIHGTLKLGIDTHGYTEIGGLVLAPEVRGNGAKLGKQISFARFLYMANNPDQFCEKVHSELMPPFDQEGKSPLWEAVGRRFLNMDYLEADKISRKSPEFILSLFPSSNIYQTLLPVEAREAVGKVGKKTVPVRNMLEKIGFTYTNEVDPFDGGPHYRCHTKNIKPIANLKSLKLDTKSFDKSTAVDCLLKIPSKHHFAAVKAQVSFNEDCLSVEASFAQNWRLSDGMELSAIPMN